MTTTTKKYKIVNGLYGWIVSCNGNAIRTCSTRAMAKDAVAELKARDAKLAR